MRPHGSFSDFVRKSSCPCAAARPRRIEVAVAAFMLHSVMRANHARSRTIPITYPSFSTTFGPSPKTVTVEAGGELIAERSAAGAHPALGEGERRGRVERPAPPPLKKVLSAPASHSAKNESRTSHRRPLPPQIFRPP